MCVGGGRGGTATIYYYSLFDVALYRGYTLSKLVMVILFLGDTLSHIYV